MVMEALVEPNLMGDECNIQSSFAPDMQTNDKQHNLVRWTKDMDCCLGHTLTGKVKQGCSDDNGLHSEAYNAAVKELNQKFESNLNKEHVISRLRTWNKHHGILKELLSRAGFEWDPERKLVVAHDFVWNAYLKEQPDAKIFYGRTIDNYDTMEILYGSICASEGNLGAQEDVLHFLDSYEKLEAKDASPDECGNQVKENPKNIRWTSAMDHHLSRILVEQVRLGNRSYDNKFKSAAYDVAVSAVNKKFQLNLTKEQIRNRIKTWKKLYKTAEELLERDEFEWSNRFNMIVGSETAWSNYYKINPEAKSLRGRIMENYNDLRVLIGHATPVECHADHGSELVTELHADNGSMETDDGLLTQSNDRTMRGKYISWTDEIDGYLINVLVEQVKLGNKIGKTFTHVAYAAVVGALSKNFDLVINREHVRNRIKVWKKLYVLARDALSHPGFKWDEKHKMVIANESLWKDYMKTNPDAKLLRARPLKYLDELRVILNHDQPVGCIFGSNGGNDVDPATIDDLNHVETDDSEEHHVKTTIPRPAPKDTAEGNPAKDSTDAASSQQTGTKPSSSSQSKQGSRKRSADEQLVELMSSVAANIGRIADALAERNQTAYLDELFQLVQNIPDFDDDLIIDACEYLSSDEKRAKMFLKLNGRLRRLWLLKRLRCHNAG